MTPLWETFGFASVRGWNAPSNGAAYEHITTQVLNANSTSVTFSAIPQGYKHLEIRYSARNGTTTQTNLHMYLNSSTTGYSWHTIYGNGTSVYSINATAQTRIQLSSAMTIYTSNPAYGSGIISILDYSSTTKNKTCKAVYGNDAYVTVGLNSGLWANTAAVSTITLQPPNGTLSVASRFSLYGIKG